MRKLFVFAMVAGLVGLGGFVREARAGVTIDLLFVGRDGGAITPTNTVTLNPGETPNLTMAVLMRNDETVAVMVYSMNYDLNLGNELDIVSQFQWEGVALNKQSTDFFAPIAGFSPTTATFVGSFQGATSNIAPPPIRPLSPSAGAFAGGYQMGTVTWHVVGASNDGVDIISGLLNFGIDGAAGGALQDLTNVIQFNGATVNVIPEPGTASLLGLGLVGILLMGRRRLS